MFDHTLKMTASAIALAVLIAAPAQAQFTQGWSGEASLTGSKTTGNTDTTDVGLGLALSKDADVWRHNFKASADFGRADGETNKKRYRLGYKLDRNINDRLYVFGNGDYFSDDFGPFQDGYFLGTGLGYSAILPEPIGWNLEAGLGFRSQKEQGPLAERTEELAGRLASNFDWALNENVSLYNDTELLYSSSDTYIWNEIGMTATLAGNLAARASFRVDTHSDVPVGTEKTDTITRFGLVYTIK